MDEKEKDKDAASTHAPTKNKVAEIPIDYAEEYKQSFPLALLTEKYMTMALDYILNTNPVTVILKNLDDLDDVQKKNIQDRVQAQMQTWLETFENVLKEGKTLPQDLIGRAADLAKSTRSK